MSLDTTSGGSAGVDGREIGTTARDAPGTRPGRLRRIALGLVGGLVATVAMSVFRMPISESPPPTANFWATYVAGGEPEEHTLIGLFLHLLYGAGGGALFASLAPVPSFDTERSQEVRGVASGVAYGLLLSVFGERVVLRRLLDMDLSPDERFVFHVSHVVYGLTLGAWVGSKLD